MPQQTSYRVEVSGWDNAECFFVEKAVLLFDDRSQQLSIVARVQEGTVVFIRLLQPVSSEENFPIPYVVSKTLPLEMDGRISVLISRLHPQPAFVQTAGGVNNHERVA